MHVTVTGRGAATVGRVPAKPRAGKTSKVTDAPPRVVVNEVRPTTPDRVSAAKGTVGQRLDISANVFADGHDVVAARVRWRAVGKKKWVDAAMTPLGNDRYAAALVPGQVGAHEFVIEGWVDAHATWRHRVAAKVAAGQDVEQDLEEGARLLEREGDRVPAALAPRVGRIVGVLRDATLDQSVRAEAALDPEVAAAVSLLPDPVQTTTSGPWPIWVDRQRAAVGSWYELFPRSYGGLKGAACQLSYVAGLGFDVVYLPPVHPIGTTARKGPGNTLDAAPDDVGSPWAIGSEEGGHDALDPALGTFADFAAFVAEAERLGIEVAMDYALQCSPDHPWVRAHPEWFLHRPDGSIRFAENPPKQYQDIFPLNFFPPDDGDRVRLWRACLEVMEFWISQGVRIFRVDNPHTKPFAFWQWLIGKVRARHPDVVLLAEAFTRPAVMHRLAEIGFSQSYTYFTWRTTKWELQEYGEELAHGPASDYFRPNLWPNTPDILSGPLRNGAPWVFAQRVVLAATLGPSWGVYSGYELAENEPASPDNEEYARSEKYELKHRDFDDPASLAPLLAQLNDVRRRHPALAELRSLRFHGTTGDSFVAYSKQGVTPDGAVDTVLVVVGLDPSGYAEGLVHIDLGALGLPWDEPLHAVEELSGDVFRWQGPDAYVRLETWRPAHVVHLRRAVDVPSA
jgi:starch synthase (maltosyl-transferring)